MGFWMWAVDYWQLDLRLALWFASDAAMLDATVWIAVSPVIAAVLFFLLLLLGIAIAGYAPRFGRHWRTSTATEGPVQAVQRLDSQHRPPRSVRA